MQTLRLGSLSRLAWLSLLLPTWFWDLTSSIPSPSLLTSASPPGSLVQALMPSLSVHGCFPWPQRDLAAGGSDTGGLLHRAGFCGSWKTSLALCCAAEASCWGKQRKKKSVLKSPGEGGQDKYVQPREQKGWKIPDAEASLHEGLGGGGRTAPGQRGSLSAAPSPGRRRSLGDRPSWGRGSVGRMPPNNASLGWRAMAPLWTWGGVRGQGRALSQVMTSEESLLSGPLSLSHSV